MPNEIDTIISYNPTFWAQLTPIQQDIVRVMLELALLAGESKGIAYAKGRIAAHA